LSQWIKGGKMKIVTSSLMILLLATACGRPSHVGNLEEFKAAFQTKIKHGRSVNFSKSEQTSGLNLASNIVRSKQDPFTGAILSYEFNSDESEAVLESNLKHAALKMIEEHQNELQVQVDELNVLENSPKVIGNLAYIQFQRHFNELRIHNAFVDVIYAKNPAQEWKLIEIVNNSYGSRRVTAKELKGVDLEAIQSVFENLTISKQEETIFPKPLSNGDMELHLATVFQLRSAEEVEYFATVSQHTGEVLESYSPKISLDNTVQAPGFIRSYMDTVQNFPLPDAEVTIAGKVSKTSLVGELPLSAAASANIRLYSSRVDIKKSGQTIKFDTNLQPGKALTPPDELSKRSLNAFLAIQRVNQFTRQHLLESQTAILKRPMNVFVDVSGSCNAFYTNTSMSLFSAGGGCANMATVNDVIYHEWGHGLDDHTGRQLGIRDDAFSEGIGDILAGYMSGSSNMAMGFYNNRIDGIRQLKNSKKYPSGLSGEPHNDGLIIGAAFWDLRTALIARYGDVKGIYLAEGFFLKHLLTTDTYKESYQTVLRLDDNDGNPATRSPNFCLITEAFANRGLAEAASGCVDQIDANRSLPTISVGIVTSSLEGSSIMISSDKAANAYLCADTKEKCLASGATLTPAVKEGTLNGKVTYLISNYPRLKEEQTLTVVLKSTANEIIGTRSFKLMKR